MAATEVIVVVGQSPLDDKYGFNAVSEMTYGSFIPDKLEGDLVSSLEMDESAGSVVLTLGSATNTLGTNAAITLASGATIDLTGVDGVYTAGTPSTDFTDVVVGHDDGVSNMMIGAMAGFSSAETTGYKTIEVTLDVAATDVLVANWSVDIDAGTDNVITAATVSGTTVTLTVTDFLENGETILVSHVRTTQIDTITDGAVTNNVVLAGFTSAGTSDSTTIAVVLDATPEATTLANWSVDVNTGTDNVITDIVIGVDALTVTVTTAIVNGDTITISHTAEAGDGVDTVTAQTVTNNET